MVHGEAWTVKELFVYPNEYIYWTIQIVMYPFLTGLVAGAFVLSSLYHVFGVTKLKEIARFSLVFSFALLPCAPMPLLLHLQQPLRNHHVLMTPHFTSAIAAFGIVFLTYGMIVASELWFVYRGYFVATARELRQKPNRTFSETTLMGLYTILVMGAWDVSHEALEKDEKAVKILAATGIPVACFLHGYAGFIFGSVKANALWMTPLMPVIFICSAVVSGIALCILTYIVTMELRKLMAARRRQKNPPLSYPDDLGGVDDVEIPRHVPRPRHHPGASRPDLPGLHSCEVVGHPSERHLRQGLHRHLHPPVRARKPGPLHPLPPPRTYHPAGGGGDAPGALRRLHDAVERGHRRSGFLCLLRWVHALPPPHLAPQRGDLQGGALRRPDDRVGTLRPLLDAFSRIPPFRKEGTSLTAPIPRHEKRQPRKAALLNYFEW